MCKCVFTTKIYFNQSVEVVLKVKSINLRERRGEALGQNGDRDLCRITKMRTVLQPINKGRGSPHKVKEKRVLTFTLPTVFAKKKTNTRGMEPFLLPAPPTTHQTTPFTVHFYSS